MINSTKGSYAFIRTTIFLLQSVTPLSVLLTALDITGSLHLHPILRLWVFAETIFYFGFQLPFQLVWLQREAEHPPLQDEASRRELFRRVTANASEFDLGRWFRGAEKCDIGRESVKDWVAWALFEGRIDAESNHPKELEGYMLQLEELFGEKFPEGRGKATPIRLTLDPIRTGPRSLVWAFCVGFVDFLTFIRLRLSGFHFHRTSWTRFFTLFPFRPIAYTATNLSPVKHTTYWHRPHTSQTHRPILFIHGIGIGLYPYIKFLDDLNASFPANEQIGILAIELMPISFRITHTALSKTHILEEISQILEYHNIGDFVLVSHSYGSVLTTHILHTPSLQSRISAVLLIDPVTFLLHHPDVAYNFTVRTPVKANEYQLWYYASQDPGVAHTLGRRFFWSENALWLEDLRPLLVQAGKKGGMKVSVSLGDRDLIVDTKAVRRYLGGEAGVDVLWFEDTDHGQVFETRGKRGMLVGVVRGFCAAE